MPSSMSQLRYLMPRMTQLRQLAVCPPQAGGEVRELTPFYRNLRYEHQYVYM